MVTRIILVMLVAAFQLHAKPPAPTPTATETNPKDVKLVEFFSVDKNPGKGLLSYISAGNTEQIKFGTESGVYALGMIFPGENLPEPYDKDFKKSDILQLAFGTLRTHLQVQVPQFGAATLIAKGPLKTRTTFQFIVPSGQEKNLRDSALLLFTSPTTPNEQTDEEKLKGTFFAQSGTVIIVPKGRAQAIQIQSQGKKYNFNMQTVQGEFKAKLVTPFNVQENDLKGSIEFPVYWPTGKGAKALAKRIAADSLTGMGTSAPMPDGLTSHKRNVAGSTKKDTSPPPKQ